MRPSMRYSTDSKERKYVQGYGFLSFARNIASSPAARKTRDKLVKHGKEAVTKASKRAVNKAAEATGDLVGQKIADKITKRSPKEKSVDSVITQVKDLTPEQRVQILKELSLV